jgi:16S rRNA (cytosine1402-N4)-methyltransferase
VALVGGLGPGGRLIGLDRDPEMLALAENATRGLPVTLVHAAYSELGDVLEQLALEAVDGILLDLGLSSDQLGWAHRGFSFAVDGPLDMRFDPETKPTAAEVVNTWNEEDLARLFFDYGEERHSRRVARRIVAARRLEPITTTGRLAAIVRQSIPGKWGKIDPATRVFQALRIGVNAELEHLDTALAQLADWLKPGGRAAVISFHSLEDRRVKVAFRDDPRLTVLTRKPVVATAQEVAVNPRARSAKLRVAERCPNLVGPPVPPSFRSPDRARKFDR